MIILFKKIKMLIMIAANFTENSLCAWHHVLAFYMHQLNKDNCMIEKEDEE